MNAARPMIDITRPVSPAIAVWPGDPPMRLEWQARLERGDPVNVASIRMGVHTGTHADAPFHVDADGARIGDIPPEVWVGEAVVVDARGGPMIEEGLVEAALDRHPGLLRILFRTDGWRGGDRFPDSFAGLTADAARRIARSGILLVGTDAPSVDAFGTDGLPAHHALAGAGIVNLENLALDGVEAGVYELIALPLRLAGVDGSPVRAVLRRP